MNYFDREFFYKRPHDNRPKERVPLLNTSTGEIAGVRCNINHSISDSDLKNIEQALNKLTFHVEYNKNFDQEYINSKF